MNALGTMLIATLIGLGTSEVTLAGDELIPPTQYTYTVRVLEASSGLPVPNLTIQALEHVTSYYCYRYVNESCTDCHPVPEWQARRLTTGADGTASTIFTLPWCALLDDDPPTWVKGLHASWGAPFVVENPSQGVYSTWILHHYQNGPDPFTQTLFVTNEAEIADRFAPVLHRHGALEVQEELGDVETTVLEHARIQGYDVLGRTLCDSDLPPVDAHDHATWDTCGEGTTPTFWRLDIDDDWRRAGAPNGERPLYVHVFPFSGGAIVQYWLWFNCNDLRNLPGGDGTIHEGDWEYVALRVIPSGESWAPARVNLSQHAGGQVLNPEELWWSATTEPSYRDLASGYDASRTHPHLWVAANSHALYSRFTPQYHLSVDLGALCDDEFADRVDYNYGGHPSGNHAFVIWDRLVDTGEYWFDPEAHGETFRNHAHGGNVEILQLFGRFGESFCSDGPDCEACENPLYEVRSWAPRSPIQPEEPHRWRSFEDSPGRWGNEPSFPADVQWKEATQIANYLGAFATCGDGSGDVIRTRIGNAPPGVPGVANIRIVQGDVEVLEATDGEVILEATTDTWYDLELSAVVGSGTIEIDVHPAGNPGALLARDLRAEIRPCGTSSVEGGEASIESADTIGTIVPSTGKGPFEIYFTTVPVELPRWTIHDASGRLVASGAVEGASVTWYGLDESARPLASGLYFVRAEGDRAVVSLGRILIVR